ncbi:hypothetical protein [uncultured Gammaproteobacteria bacterium]|nr:hypothetical protein [uncultured Gammaproteobacteria bacterium]
MNNIFLIILQTALFLVSINASANTIKTKIENTKTVYTSVTKQQLAETKIKFFDITNEEYARAETYKSLALEMDKNNTLSTLEILGMYAETKAEKRKYARKFSKLFYQYTDRVLGFQKLIRQANKDFYGNPSMFDYVPVQKKQSEPKRVSRAIELKDCNQLCVDEVKRLIKLAIIFPVDFYFRNATDLEIQQWASQLEINSDIVNEGFITLNHAY